MPLGCWSRRFVGFAGALVAFRLAAGVQPSGTTEVWVTATSADGTQRPLADVGVEVDCDGRASFPPMRTSAAGSLTIRGPLGVCRLKAISRAKDGIGGLLWNEHIKFSRKPGRLDLWSEDATVLPVLVHSVDPVYPEALRAAGVGGRVRVHLVVRRNGAVDEVSVRSSNNEGFADAALEAVSQRKYEPAQRHGVPVEVELTEIVAFEPGLGPSAASGVGERSNADIRSDNPPAATPLVVQGKSIGQPLGELDIRVMLPPDSGGERLCGPLTLQLTCTSPVAFSTRFRVGEPGTITIRAPEGRCLLESPFWIRHGGRRYAWRENVVFSAGTSSALTLSRENALAADTGGFPTNTEGSVSNPGARGDDVQNPPAQAAPTAPASETTQGVESDGAGRELVAPELYFKVEPQFPDLARRARVEGSVILQVALDKEGHVSETRVLSSSNPMFDEAAREAVMQWRYKPAVQNGKPVSVYYTVRSDFRLR